VQRPSACVTTLGRFSGPAADELSIVCRPDAPGDVARQAEAAYRALAGLVAAEHGRREDVVAETLFLRDIRRDLPPLLAARARVLAALAGRADGPAPAFIQQAPLAPEARFVLAASVVIPRRREAWSVREVAATPSCPCDGCKQAGARLVRLGDHTTLHATNLYGTGGDASGEASDMFDQAERLLARCGMGFHDVVRTWIYLRDIDRDYHALNQARRDFLRRQGIALRPASTGVGGIPFPDGHRFCLRLQALQSSRPRDVTVMSTPLLNEAWRYGAEFSRGLRVVETNKVTLHVSGTASIDESGNTVHVGDFAAQADRMLQNIATLLAGQRASFEHVTSAVAYVKRADDAATLASLCVQRGFDGFPFAVVETPLCRPELLCEIEAEAVLPLAGGAA
jgi:enamine deaminase RidA (YjgF/YER057c/UK114 family)